MLTKAAVLYETGKDLRIEELEIPDLGKGQVMVKLACSGVCHTQLNEVQGKNGPDRWLPHVLGHEGSGVVEEIGPDVTKVAPGDRVVLTWITGEGTAAAPIGYKSIATGEKVNSGPVSTFGEYVVVSEQKVVPIGSSIPMDAAAMLGCAIPTGAGVVRNTFNAMPDDSLVVIGVGGVGLSTILGAASIGLKKIIAVDVREEKLKLACEFGATDIIRADTDDVEAAVKEFTDGQGADYAFEAAGTVASMELGLKLIKNTGTFAIAGNLAKGETIRINPFDLIVGKRIIGTWGGETQPDRDIPFYEKCIEEGTLQADKLVSHRFPLDGINEALSLLEGGQVSRALIEFKP